MENSETTSEKEKLTNDNFSLAQFDIFFGVLIIVTTAIFSYLFFDHQIDLMGMEVVKFIIIGLSFGLIVITSGAILKEVIKLRFK